ncbi:uncharacterized protein LOC104441264 [Eucalyptus grandis]|uniref:uncharacterized protein LOC104441264 n=1 Tax=Eucalyptus grandis TaxID=71139 RepID=UPI00192EC21C|nr:uncharacterized protein LOC104441264 [Eucalyptus grandis]
MELSVSHPSSLRVPAITPLRSSASSPRRDGRGGKPTCQCSTGLYFKFSQGSPSLGASSPKSRSRPAPRRSNGRSLIQVTALLVRVDFGYGASGVLASCAGLCLSCSSWI